MKRIFLDTAAGTNPNPASLHKEGVMAKKILDDSRKKIAEVLAAHPDEIIFTSGGTEGNNLAILGLPRGDVVISAIEHPSVLEAAALRNKNGLGKVLVVPVDSEGIIKLDELAKIISPETVVVSIMYANNEIGTIEPIVDVAKLIRQVRKKFNQVTPYLHIDACQAPRFLSLDVRKLGVDLMTINSGKIYGPRGIGALFVKRGVPLKPLLVGGGQEADRRAGTENYVLAKQFAEALLLASKLKERESKNLTKLRDYFVKRVLKEIPDAHLNGGLNNRLPNNVNLSFPGVLGEQLVLELDARGIAASTGSACSIPKHDDSYVILALGKTKNMAESALRLSFPRDLTKTQVDYAIKTLKEVINNLRKNNHAYFAQFIV